jgi:hypothetical protein
MQWHKIFFMFIIFIGVIVASGCLSMGSTNANALIRTAPSVTPFIEYTTTTPIVASSIPVTITATPTQTPSYTELSSEVKITGSDFYYDSAQVQTYYSTMPGGYCDKMDTGIVSLYGYVTSKSQYPLKVDLELDFFNSPSISVSNTIMYDSIIVKPMSTATYNFKTPYTMYCGTGADYDVEITNVSIADQKEEETMGG